SFTPEQVCEGIGEVRFVLDDKDAGHACSPFRALWVDAPAELFLVRLFLVFLAVLSGTGASMRGSTIVKVDPRPGRDHTLTSPPCRCVACLTIDNPSPVPPVRRERASSAR